MYIGLSILAELILIALLILLFYRLKPRFGLLPLYVLLGSNQFLQTILSTSFKINIPGGLSITPGAIIVVSSSLFAILLIYIKEGVRSTQALIIGIIVANMSFTLFGLITNLQETAMQDIIYSSGTAQKLFKVNFRVFFVGTIVLIMDALLIVILYEFFFTKQTRFNLFTRLLFTMLIVLNFDAVLFMGTSFWNSANLGNKIISQMVGKSVAALFFATVLYVYLYYFDNKKNNSASLEEKGKEDIFSILTYKGRYEKLKTDKAISDEELKKIIAGKTLEMEKSIRRFTILTSVSELRMDKSSLAEQAKEFLIKVKEAFEVDACTIHLIKNEKLEMLSSIGLADHEQEKVSDLFTSYFKDIITKKSCIAIEDTSKDNEWIKYREKSRVKFNYISCAGAPLYTGNKVIGIIRLYSRTEKRIFTALETEHLQLIAIQAAHAIENSILFEQNEKHKEVLVKQIIVRKKGEELIKENAEQLRQLTTHLQNIREEERKRIGREIHDDLGQQLTAIKMDVAWIDKKIPGESTIIKSKINNIISLLDGSHISVRRILNELRTDMLENYGLIDALEWQGRQFTSNTNIPLIFNCMEAELNVDDVIATCIYRAFQESLTNITRYANAQQVIASLNSTGTTIEFTIEDDGAGFDTTSLTNNKSFGILGMKERVASLKGKFELHSSPGNGTTINISLPFKSEKTDIYTQSQNEKI